jgi:hypothetical protein
MTFSTYFSPGVALQGGGGSSSLASPTITGVASFANGTIAAPSIKIGSAQTGLAVDPATANSLSLVYASTEYLRLSFSSVFSPFVFCSNGTPNIVLGTSAAATNPAFKKSGTFAHARLGDDSAFCGFAAANVQAATAYTVATLPGTPGTGMIARVTDALAPTIGTTVAGGGAAYALVNYNGAAWTVIGV